MPAAAALTDSFTSTTGGASFSKSCAIGAAASDRVIAVVVIGQNSASGATYTCTIGGAAATGAPPAANNRSVVRIFYLPVPSGTTATVEVASSTNFDNCHFSVHRLTGIDASTGITGSQVGTSTAASLAVTVNPTAAGIALAGVRAARASHRASVASAIVATGSQTITAAISGTDSGVTWTGLTEASETVVAAAGSSVQAMAVAVWYEAAPTGVTGDASLILSAVTASAEGSLSIGGGVAGTLGAVAVLAEGALGISADASVTLGPVSSAAGGAVGVSGDGAVLLGAVTASAVGSIGITGSASITLGAVTVVAAGSLGGDAVQITPVPPSRVFAVARDVRLFAVSAEVRTFAVPAELRIFRVKGT